jgi:glycosyltransferase involved in cell wall biosynthesis
MTTSGLSVVLPNYNHAQLVGRALNALLDQERPPDEIIVIDDGSTDNSVEVIGAFAARAPSIRLLLNGRNQGVIATLQRGLDAARGDYVYFAAADDLVLAGFFALALRRLAEHPGLGLFCGEAVLVNSQTGRPFAVRPAVRPRAGAGPVMPAEVQRLLRTTDNWILTGSAVFRRECVQWAGGFDARLGSFADGFLARKTALKFGFFFEPQIVAAWVVFPDSVSRRSALELERATTIRDVVPAHIAADSAFPAWYAAAFRDRWRFATCRLALQAEPVDRELVLAMGAASPVERAQLGRLLSLPGRSLVRLSVLVLLWYRLRPTSLVALLRTRLARRPASAAMGFHYPGLASMTTRSGLPDKV